MDDPPAETDNTSLSLPPSQHHPADDHPVVANGTSRHEMGKISRFYTDQARQVILPGLHDLIGIQHDQFFRSFLVLAHTGPVEVRFDVRIKQVSCQPVRNYPSTRQNVKRHLECVHMLETVNSVFNE